MGHGFRRHWTPICGRLGPPGRRLLLRPFTIAGIWPLRALPRQIKMPISVTQFVRQVFGQFVMGDVCPVVSASAGNSTDGTEPYVVAVLLRRVESHRRDDDQCQVTAVLLVQGSGQTILRCPCWRMV